MVRNESRQHQENQYHALLSSLSDGNKVLLSLRVARDNAASRTFLSGVRCRVRKLSYSFPISLRMGFGYTTMRRKLRLSNLFSILNISHS